MASSSEDQLKLKLQDLQKQIGKKQMFHETVSNIKSLMIENYPSASPSLRKLIYTVVCRVATVLQTRYTAPGFWFAGTELFEQAECLVTEPSEKQHLQSCITRARELLHEKENQPEVLETNGGRSTYLFEGHLTVDAEPPRPAWLQAQDFLTLIAAQATRDNFNITELMEILANMQVDEEGFTDLDAAIQASLQEVTVAGGPKIPPPASKEVVTNLPIITITEEIFTRLDIHTKCSVCQEELVVDDKMQELPCKHFYHPACLKTWLDERNSCPECRYELPTDDHNYESRKEREKEAEEERKGVENALRGGEYMYV